MKKKILVTGANGQLGKELQQLAAVFPVYEFIFLSREDMPIHHFQLIRNTFKAYQPAYCINCAAYTAVDKAETDRDLAFQVNAEAVGILAAVCNEYGTLFIHISTDYVFDGTATTPYRPDSITNPQSVYGATKLEGERQAIQLNPASIIIRTSWVYAEFGKNFVKTMLRLMNEKDEITVVNDQIGSPTYAADLAEAILHIIKSANWHPGIYHFSNTGIISWYDFAMEIKNQIQSNCLVKPIPTSAYLTPAKRPAYSVMDTSKISNTYQLVLKDWKASLAICLAKLKTAQQQ